MFLRLELGNGEEERIKKGQNKRKKTKRGEDEKGGREEENDNDVVFGTHSKTLFIVHRKFKYNWVALYGNPKPVPGKRLSISMSNVI